MNRNKYYHRLLSSSRWQNLRRQILTARPLCVMCRKQNRYTLAVQVHHIRPVESGRSKAQMERLAFDPNNLMPICQACHKSIHTHPKGEWMKSKDRAKKEAAEAIAKYFESG